MFGQTTESSIPHFKSVDADAHRLAPKGGPTHPSKKNGGGHCDNGNKPQVACLPAFSGSLLYYYKTQCTDNFALLDNSGWVITDLSPLQTLREAEGVTIKEIYAMGYSTSSFSNFGCSTSSSHTSSTNTTSVCEHTWDTYFETCSDDCLAAHTISVWYKTCTTWATAVSDAVSYAAYVDLVVTLLVIVVYGCCTGQLRSGSGRDKMMSVVVSEAGELGINSSQKQKIQSRRAVLLVDEEDGSLQDDVNRTLQLMENDRQRMQLRMDEMDDDRLKIEQQLLDLRSQLKLLRPGPFDGRDQC